MATSRFVRRSIFSSMLFLLITLGAMGQGCGFMWQSSNPSIPADEFHGMAWNGSTYVIIGGGPTILTSPDGTTWTRQPVPGEFGSYPLTGVAWGNGTFVITVQWGGILTSPDGFTWTPHYYGPNFSGGDEVLTFAHNLFLFGSYYDNLSVSSDGVTWQAASGITGVRNFAYGAGAYVAVSSSGSIYSSTDGVTWLPRQSLSSGYFNAVAYGNGAFVAMGWTWGTSSAIYEFTSSDGVNWTTRTSPTSISPVAIVFGDGTFYMWDMYANEFQTTDGITWKSVDAVTPNNFSCVAYEGGRFFMLLAPGDVLISPDAATWQSQKVDLTSADLHAVVYDGDLSLFVAAGDGGTLLTSPDGIQWTPRASGVTANLYALAQGWGTLVAVGDGGTILASQDGLAWTAQASRTTASLGGVAFGAGIFVAVAGAGAGLPATVVTSQDGLAWTLDAPVPPPLNLADVVYDGGRFVALSYDGYIFSSPDGHYWAVNDATLWNGSSYPDHRANISYCGGNYFAGDWSSAYSSPDASLWSTVEQPDPNNYGIIGRTSYHMGQFITPKNYYDRQEVLVSPDSNRWTALPTMYLYGLWALAYGDSVTVGVGAHGTILRSGCTPVVYATAPLAGPLAGGTPVVIRGGSFTGATDVIFGDTKATSFTVDSDTQITAISPPHQAGWGWYISVRGPGGESPPVQAAQFVWTAPPDIFGLIPPGGPVVGGTVIQIQADGLYDQATVTFDGVPAAATLINGWLTAVCPPHAPGTVDVVVTSAGGTGTPGPASRFTYYLPPVITGVVPSVGPTTGGGEVTITGQNLQSVSQAYFGDYYVSCTAQNDTSALVSWTPMHDAGTVDVIVTTLGGTSAIVPADRYTFAVLPSVSGVSPAIGPTGGGVAVTLTGLNFKSSSTVNFGAASATNVAVVSPTTITCTSPAGTGTTDVTVTTDDGTSAPTLGDKFTFTAAPIIYSVTPSTGSTRGQTNVTIKGGNFSAGDIVYFYGGLATNVVAHDAFTLTCLTPACATSGWADITVYAPGGGGISGTLPGGFEYIFPPSLTSLTPSAGYTLGGTSVMLSGANFMPGVTVTFGGVPSPDAYWDGDTAIWCTTPAHVAGLVSVTVTNPDGQFATNSNAFTYVTPPAPTLTNVSPTLGPTAGGTYVTLTGAHFLDGATAYFGGTLAAGIWVVGDTTITCTTPAHAAGYVSVMVKNPDGQSATKVSAFAFQAPPAPTLTNVSPTTGPTAGGTNVTLTGAHYLSGATVTFGGVSASGVSVVSGTSITCTTPAHAAGAVSVMVKNPDGQSATKVSAFTFQAPPAPALTSVSPTTGPTAGGTNVTLTGAHYLAGATVTFGGLSATGVSVVSSSSITCMTPAHAVGAATVMVKNPDGQSATKVNAFTFQAPPPPTVTSLAPNRGGLAGGTSVTISGTGFTGATAVKFGTSSAAFTFVSASTITATSPTHIAGAVYVTVTTPNGTSAAGTANQFTYVGAPAVGRLTPTRGPVAGGTSVTIAGSNFSGATSVTFGGVAASSFTVLSSSQISVKAPAHAAGIVDVQVTTPYGTSAIGTASKYTYY